MITDDVSAHGLTYVNLSSHPHLEAVVDASVRERNQAIDTVSALDRTMVTPEHRLMILGVISSVAALRTALVPNYLLGLLGEVAQVLNAPVVGSGIDLGEGP